MCVSVSVCLSVCLRSYLKQSNVSDALDLHFNIVQNFDWGEILTDTNSSNI